MSFDFEYLKYILTLNRNKINTSSKWWQQDHFEKFGTTLWVLLSSNQNYNMYWICKYFEEKDEEADKNGRFHWTLTSPS